MNVWIFNWLRYNFKCYFVFLVDFCKWLIVIDKCKWVIKVIFLKKKMVMLLFCNVYLGWFLNVWLYEMWNMDWIILVRVCGWFLKFFEV